MQYKNNELSSNGQMIAIFKKNGENVVSARELYIVLDIKERFSRWFERMCSYAFEEGIDFTPYQNVHPSNNHTLDDYALTLDMAKEVSMLQRSEIGKQVRKHFITIEKEQRNQSFSSNQIYTSTLDSQELSLAKKEKMQLAQLKETRDELSIVRSAPRICNGCGKIVRGKKGLYAHSRYCVGNTTLSLFQKGGDNG